MYNIRNGVPSFCFVIIDLRSLTKTYIHMCYKCLACESKMAYILYLMVCSSVGCSLRFPLFPYLKVMGCPLKSSIFPYIEVVGSLICMAKFPRVANGQPTPMLNELPTVSIYGSSGQSHLHGKIPTWSPQVAYSTAHIAGQFFMIWSRQPNELLFPYIEVVDRLICMAKFPRSAHGQPTRLLMCSQWATNDFSVLECHRRVYNLYM